MDEKKVIRIINAICEQGKNDFKDVIKNLKKFEKPIKQHSTEKIYNLMVNSFSFFNTKDYIAIKYREEHGEVTFRQVKMRMKKTKQLCPKLINFKTFNGCGYEKGYFDSPKKKCKIARYLNCCPVASHDLRNGRLNINAYSLYLFIRDICDNDIVTHIDQIIKKYPKSSQKACDELISEFHEIYNVGLKLANMTLSDLLCSKANDSLWFNVGTKMVAVDSLVHYFLNRTGLLRFYGKEHPYNEKYCYSENGCYSVITKVSRLIDASNFNKNFPTYYPRFVQFLIWTHCSEDYFNICNNKNIQKKQRCSQKECIIFKYCDRLAVH